jgi:hypothetical protein
MTFVWICVGVIVVLLVGEACLIIPDKLFRKWKK